MAGSPEPAEPGLTPAGTGPDRTGPSRTRGRAPARIGCDGSDQPALLNASYTFLGIRPRAGTSKPFDCAHARTVAGVGAMGVRL